MQKLNSFQQVPSPTQLRDSMCSTAPPKHQTRSGALPTAAESDLQAMLNSRYHPLGDQPGSSNPLPVPPPPIAVLTATPSPRISAGHPGVHRFGPSDTAAAAKSRSPDTGPGYLGLPSLSRPGKGDASDLNDFFFFPPPFSKRWRRCRTAEASSLPVPRYHSPLPEGHPKAGLGAGSRVALGALARGLSRQRAGISIW